MFYEVERSKDTVIVAVIKHKVDGKFSFVNITKKHICPCKFDSVKDAEEDLERYKRAGKIINYRKIDFYDICDTIKGCKLKCMG